MRTINDIKWNVAKVKSKNSLDWFKEVVAGYVKNGYCAKPTDTQVKDLHDKLTGKEEEKAEMAESPKK